MASRNKPGQAKAWRLLTFLFLLFAGSTPAATTIIRGPVMKSLYAGSVATQPDYLIPTKTAGYANTSNNTFYATNIWTFRSNSLAVVAVSSSGTAGAITLNPVGSGMGLTWTLQKQTNFSTLTTPTATLCVYTALTGTTNPSGVFKVDFSPNTMNGVCIQPFEFWNASNSIVQIVAVASNATANPKITYAACAQPGTNAFFLAIADNVNSTADATPDSGDKWSEISELAYTTTACGLTCDYSLAANPTTTVVTNIMTSRDWAAILLEIQPNIVAIPTPPLPVDLFVDFENSTDGTLVTTTIATNGTHPSGSFSGQMWQTLSNIGTLKVSTAQAKSLPHSVSVSGTPYDDAGATRGWRVENSPWQNREFFKFNLPSTQTNISFGHYFRFDPSNLTNWAGATPDFNNYNFSTISCVGGEEVVLLVVNKTAIELRTETSVETSGSSETTFPNPATNKWYWITMTLDKSRLIGRMMVFDTSTTPWQQVGYSDAVITSDDATLLAIGRWDQHGSSTNGGWNYYDGYIAKWGDIQSRSGGGFPLVP